MKHVLMSRVSGFLIAASLSFGAATAQENSVTLRSFDGTFEASGILLDAQGNSYVINTEIGELKVRKEFVECLGEGCPSAVQEVEVADKTVELRSFDGTSSFKGELVAFDGTTYDLSTTLGMLKVRSEFVECVGPGCPEILDPVDRFTIMLPEGIGETLIGGALNRFAEEKSLTLTGSFSSDGSGTKYLVADDKGEVVAEVTAVPAKTEAVLDALRTGDATIAITRHQLTAEEIANTFAVSVDEASTLLSTKTLGLDAVTPTVHPSNSVLSLSVQQIAGIMSGQITDWSEVGGREGEIHAYELGAEHELSDFVARRMFAPLGGIGASVADVRDDVADLNAAIASDPQGFGLSYRSEIAQNRSPSLQATCGIVSSSTPFLLQSEEYPMAMRWHQYSLATEKLPPFATSFSEYLLTDAGQGAIDRAGLVGLEIDRLPMFAQGERLLSAVTAGPVSNQDFRLFRSYLARLSGAERLSPTLRFLYGSAQLDAKALRDVQRISSLVADGTLEGRKIILVGFSDSIGRFAANVRLSQIRAEQVKRTLLAENVGFLEPADIEAFGFGPIAPVGCNETEAGRDMNRRVEVWVN